MNKLSLKLQNIFNRI